IQYLDVKFFPRGDAGLDPFIWRGAFGNRVFSTFGNPNFYGDFLVVMAPIVLAMFFKTRSFFLGVLYLMTAFNVYQTHSKGAWIGFVFGFVAFCFFAITFISYFKKEKIRKIIIGTAVLILIIAIPLLIKATKARMDSVKFRVYTWMSCWEMINTKPILGTGIGTFYVTYPAWRRPQIFFIEGKHNTESDHPENEYLEVWYDEGIIGLAIFLWIIVQCLKAGWQNLKLFSQSIVIQAGTKGKTHKVPEDPRTYYMLGFLSAFCGMLSHNFVCVSLRFVSSGIYLWLLVGLINMFSVNNQLPQQESFLPNRKNPVPKQARQIFYIGLIVLAYYLITIFWGFFIGDIHHNIAIFHSKRGEWSSALTNYNIVTRNNFGFVMSHYFMGNVFNDRWILDREYHPEWGDTEKDKPWTEYNVDKKGRVDPERSISQYEDVWSIAPNYVQSHHQAGLVYLKLGDMAKKRGDMGLAKKYWEKAIYRFERYHSIDPIFAQNYYRLAWIYIQMGDYARAEETYMRHLYTKDALFTPGTDEKEWVSQQLGRPATSI
ncbi:MAG: O-antigen ligase family protein, partial [Bacteroidales bacterium]